MSTYIRGGEVGAIAKDGKELFKQYDYLCGRHKFPVKMIPVHVEEIIKDDKILITLSKMCPRCRQIILEGEYLK